MNEKKQKKHCKDCKFYWTLGDNKNHCCLFGKPADKAIGQCVNTGAKQQGGKE